MGENKPTVSDLKKVANAVGNLGDRLENVLRDLVSEIHDLDLPRKSDPQIEESTGLVLRKYTKLEPGNLILAEGMVEAIRQDNVDFQRQAENLRKLNDDYAKKIAFLSLENTRLADMVRNAGFDPEVKIE